MNESFTVGLNHQEVLRRRARVRRTRMVGGSVVLLMSAIGIGLATVLATVIGSQYWPVALLIGASFLLMAAPTLKAMAVSEKLKRWYDANGLPPYAMRMTPAALELGVEGASAPVVLPWPAVSGLQVKGKFGQPVLEVLLQPGVTPASPGVFGLDHPAAKATLGPSKWIKSAGFYSVASLDRPLEAIAQALHHYSQGQATLR